MTNSNVAVWLAKRKRRRAMTPYTSNKRFRVGTRVPPRSTEVKVSTQVLSGTVANNAVAVQEFTLLATGSDVEDRVGNRIRALKIQARGFSERGVDFYLIRAIGSSVPVYSDFNASAGGFIGDNDATTKYSEMYHTTGGLDGHSTGANNAVHLSKNFGIVGLDVRYDGISTTSGSKNRMFLVAKNNSGAAREINMCMRMFYTDN